MATKKVLIALTGHGQLGRRLCRPLRTIASADGGVASGRTSFSSEAFATLPSLRRISLYLTARVPPRRDNAVTIRAQGIKLCKRLE